MNHVVLEFNPLLCQDLGKNVEVKKKKQVWLTFPNISKNFEIMGESIQNEVANQTPPTIPLVGVDSTLVTWQ